MKNRHQEMLGRSIRQFHRSQKFRWNLDQHKLMLYTDFDHPSLSGKPFACDHIGFVVNGKRVSIWLQHPRHIYRKMIGRVAKDMSGEAYDEVWLDNAEKVFHKVGRGNRKKICGHVSHPMIEETNRYFDELTKNLKALRASGIDFEVKPSFGWYRHKLNFFVEMVAPIELRSAETAAEVVKLAKSLMRGNTTIEAEFPGYIYGKKDWLRDQKALHEPQP